MDTFAQFLKSTGVDLTSQSRNFTISVETDDISVMNTSSATSLNFTISVETDDISMMNTSSTTSLHLLVICMYLIYMLALQVDFAQDCDAIDGNYE